MAFRAEIPMTCRVTIRVIESPSKGTSDARGLVLSRVRRAGDGAASELLCSMKGEVTCKPEMSSFGNPSS